MNKQYVYIHKYISIISIYQIGGKQFLRVLISYRNLEYPWILNFTVLGTERKMACGFAKVSEEEIVANEAAFFFVHLRVLV